MFHMHGGLSKEEQHMQLFYLHALRLHHIEPGGEKKRWTISCQVKKKVWKCNC